MSGNFLLVDDNGALVRAVTRLVRPHGVATTAGSVRDAEVAVRTKPEWCGFIIDISLPDGSGLDLLERLRTGHPLTPALLLTGHSMPHMINRAYDLRAEYVVKPLVGDRIKRFLRIAESLEPRGPLSSRVERVVAALACTSGLTEAEADILARSALGETRADIARARGASEATVKTQIGRMLVKCGQPSLAAAVGLVLREVSRLAG